MLKEDHFYSISPPVPLIPTKRELGLGEAVVHCSQDRWGTRSAALIPHTERWWVSTVQSLLTRRNHSALTWESMVIRIMLQLSDPRNSQLKGQVWHMRCRYEANILLEFCCLLLDLVKTLQAQKYIHFFHHTRRGFPSTDLLFSHLLTKLQPHLWNIIDHLIWVQGWQEENLIRVKSILLHAYTAPTIRYTLYFVFWYYFREYNYTAMAAAHMLVPGLSLNY